MLRCCGGKEPYSKQNCQASLSDTLERAWRQASADKITKAAKKILKNEKASVDDKSFAEQSLSCVKEYHLQLSSTRVKSLALNSLDVSSKKAYLFTLKTLLKQAEKLEDFHCLGIAFTYNNLEAAKLLIESDKVKLTHSYPYCGGVIIHRFDALEEAIIKGSEELIQILLEKKLAIKDRHISQAIKQKRESLALRLLRQMQPSSPLLLLQASEAGMPQLVQKLIEQNFDPLTRNYQGESCLHLAVKSPSKETLELLLKQGIDVDLRNESGKTALHLAIESNKASAVKLLLEEGANPHLLAHAHQSHSRPYLEGPLHMAIYGNMNEAYDDIIELLLHAKADPQLDLKFKGSKLTSDCNALDLAIQESRMKASVLLLKYIKEPEILNQAIARLRKLNGEAANCSMEWRNEALKLLIKAGAQVDENDAHLSKLKKEVLKPLLIEI